MWLVAIVMKEAVVLVGWRNKSDEYAREHWKIFLVFQKQKAFFTTFNLLFVDHKTFITCFTWSQNILSWLSIFWLSKNWLMEEFQKMVNICSDSFFLHSSRTHTHNIHNYITNYNVHNTKGLYPHLKHGKRMCETIINLEENISTITRAMHITQNWKAKCIFYHF